MSEQTSSEILGKYDIVRPLGEGVFEQVSLARAIGIEGFERFVVLKRFLNAKLSQPAWRAQFVSEARVSATLQHQNVLQTIDMGETDHEYYFALECIHGEDLRSIMAEHYRLSQQPPLEIAIHICSEAANGLHYAHERRDNRGESMHIVHRNISPSSIVVGFDGGVKIADFGIAKAFEPDGTIPLSRSKLSYSAPEICLGGEADRRSDVYSLAVVLYEFITISRMFKENTDEETLNAIITSKIQPASIRRLGLPMMLDRILTKALSANPSLRFQTCDDFSFALVEFARQQRLSLSTNNLVMFMKRTFGERPEPWLEEEAAPENLDSTFDEKIDMSFLDELDPPA